MEKYKAAPLQVRQIDTSGPFHSLFLKKSQNWYLPHLPGDLSQFESLFQSLSLYFLNRHNKACLCEDSVKIIKDSNLEQI